MLRRNHCRNLQLLNYWIIIKTKVVLPQAYVTLADLAILFRSFGVYAHKLFGFQILWNWAHLMKVIPETDNGSLLTCHDRDIHAPRDRYLDSARKTSL
jgi:hypothetical protein